jgi:hypothetical protein
MAIKVQHERSFRGSKAMKSQRLVTGVVALVAFQSAAAAGVTVELKRSASVVGGASRGGMTLAKAKKRKRPGGSSSGSKSDTGGDDSGAGDDDSGKSASASSSDSSSDAANEDELLGSKKKPAPKPAAKPIARDDSDDSSGGGGDDDTPVKKAPKAVKSVETVETTASEEPSEATSSSALEFGLGAKALFRNLSWTNDARAANLGPYSLTPGPETSAWFEFYPAAFGTSGFAANVGLFGKFDYGFGVATTLANGNNVATKFRDFQAGLKVRIPFGTFIPNISVAYGQQVFEIAQQGNAFDLPQLAYQFVRPSAGARYYFTPTIALDGAVGYLLVLDPGSGANHVRASNFFPDAKAFGFDVSASVVVRVSGAIGVRGGADLRQYILNMNDKTAPTVGGAVDRYITAWAGLEVVLDGMGAAAGGDDEPAKPSKRSRRHRAEPKPDDESEDGSKSEDE